MSDGESRSLGWVALLLLAASVVRFVWGSPEASPPAAGPDVLPGLLAESRNQAAEAQRRSAPLGAEERLDPNRATAAELDRLPGVGPAIAEALVRSREADGPYRTGEDLLRVRGVGPALLARIRPHLELAPSGPPPRRPPRKSGPAPPPRRAPPPKPVDVNVADTLALQALPGVGPALARRIVEARAGSPFRSVDDLLRVRGIGPATLERLRPLVAVSR